METYALTPIALVQSTRTAPTDDGWDAVEATIVLTPTFGPDAFAGLDAFSHVEIVFLFHRADPARAETGARRPRGNPDWPPTGIFAQRGKDRPNRLGVTRCRLLAVEGTTLHVQGLDAIDATPVLDIKPVMTGFETRGAITEPSWATDLMAGYWEPT